GPGLGRSEPPGRGAHLSRAARLARSPHQACGAPGAGGGAWLSLAAGPRSWAPRVSPRGSRRPGRVTAMGARRSVGAVPICPVVHCLLASCLLCSRFTCYLLLLLPSRLACSPVRSGAAVSPA